MELQTQLQTQLSIEREKLGLVGFAAMISVDGVVVAKALDGRRVAYFGSELEEQDLFHIGSISKSFTSTLAARLVERGLIDWQLTISDVFPASEYQPQWAEVNLLQLLNHTSGAPANFPFLVMLRSPAYDEKLMSRRLAAVLDVLGRVPAYEPGSAFVYSNVGLTIAAAMLEKKLGLPWERLVVQDVAKPLGLNSVGFGAPSGEPDGQARGHKRVLGLQIASTSDNTAVIAPAGGLHMSTADLLHYGEQHRLGELGLSDYLPKESFIQLHHSSANNYALAWVDADEEWAGGRFFWHNGSNTYWYSLLVVVPQYKAVLVFNANDGQVAKVQDAAWRISKQIITALAASPVNK